MIAKKPRFGDTVSAAIDTWELVDDDEAVADAVDDDEAVVDDDEAVADAVDDEAVVDDDDEADAVDDEEEP